MLPKVPDARAGVIAMALAALLIIGCSDSEARSQPNPRTSNSTNAQQQTKGTDTNAAAASKRDFTPPPLESREDNTNTTSASKTNLNPQQIAELKTKAEKGDAAAQYELAQVYFNAGVPADETEAYKWFTRAAESGHAKAAYKLAHAYKSGWGKLGTNTNLALRWLKAAAERGHLPAQTSLATSYRYDAGDVAFFLLSWGTGKDLSEAVKWYRNAAEQGDAGAQEALGEMYLHGEGVPTNISEGLRLLEQAIAGYEPQVQRKESVAEFFIASICSRLGDYFFKGQLLPKNITNAIHYYEKAANAPAWTDLAGEAQSQLGYIHATETKNFAEAAKWYRKRAEAGEPTAQYNLAICLYNGEGIERNRNEAAKWFRASAEQGNVDAQWRLGMTYRNGEGVPRDYGEAVKWIRKAAEQGDYSAQNNLGVAYNTGEGVPRDYVEAYKWYNLAAASGENAELRETSRRNLDIITRLMTPEQIAEAQRRSSAFVARKETEKLPPNRATHTPSNDEPEHPQATGTAFFITDDGYLLTSAHVVSPTEQTTGGKFSNARPVMRIEVTVAGKTYRAKLVKADKANDAVVLKITGNFRALPLAPSRAAKLGETICTLGFPNTDIQGTEPKFTTGEVNSLAGIQDDPRHFQISVPVQPGNSGGPLLV